MTSVKGKLLFFRSEFFKNNPPIILSCILDGEADGFLVKGKLFVFLIGMLQEFSKNSQKILSSIPVGKPDGFSNYDKLLNSPTILHEFLAEIRLENRWLQLMSNFYFPIKILQEFFKYLITYLISSHSGSLLSGLLCRLIPISTK